MTAPVAFLRLSAPLIVSLAVLVLLVLSQVLLAHPARAAAALAGFAGGVALYHASFGFAGGWRRFVMDGDGSGIRSQMLLIALVSPVSLTLISGGHASGWVVPVGVGFLVGAAMFGAGMSLAGSCASGTLFVMGGGSIRMAVTLAAFVAGSLIGTAHVPFWLSLPQAPAVSLPDALGTPGAVAATLGISAGVALAVSRPRRRDRARPYVPTEWSALRGPWPSWAGAVVLALVCLSMFLALGRPWGVTEGFALWGAKIADALGVPVGTWPYWAGGRTAQLAAPVLSDATSVTNFALVAGAMAAAAAADRFRPVWRIGRTDLATAIAGGLLMGYGARLSSGCNIGAFLGGVTSGSLHGWVWAAAAFAAYTGMMRLRSGTGAGAARRAA